MLSFYEASSFWKLFQVGLFVIRFVLALIAVFFIEVLSHSLLCVKYNMSEGLLFSFS